eukprot:3004990-Prymnesium_polylepis.1
MKASGASAANSAGVTTAAQAAVRPRWRATGSDVLANGFSRASTTATTPVGRSGPTVTFRSSAKDMD